MKNLFALLLIIMYIIMFTSCSVITQQTEASSTAFEQTQTETTVITQTISTEITQTETTGTAETEEIYTKDIFENAVYSTHTDDDWGIFLNNFIENKGIIYIDESIINHPGEMLCITVFFERWNDKNNCFDFCEPKEIYDYFTSLGFECKIISNSGLPFIHATSEQISEFVCPADARVGFYHTPKPILKPYEIFFGTPLTESKYELLDENEIHHPVVKISTEFTIEEFTEKYNITDYKIITVPQFMSYEYIANNLIYFLADKGLIGELMNSEDVVLIIIPPKTYSC